MISPMKWQVDEVLDSIERMEQRQLAEEDQRRFIERLRLAQLERESGCNDPE